MLRGWSTVFIIIIIAVMGKQDKKIIILCQRAELIRVQDSLIVVVQESSRKVLKVKERDERMGMLSLSSAVLTLTVFFAISVFDTLIHISGCNFSSF